MVGLGAAKSLGDISLTWNYQACTELVLEPLTSDGDGFYVEDDSQIAEVAARCQQIFGDIVTRPFWSPMVRALPTAGRRGCVHSYRFSCAGYS